MHKLQVRTVTGLRIFHIADYNIICLLKKNYYCNFESEYISELNIFILLLYNRYLFIIILYNR